MTDQPERNQPMTKETAALLRPGDLLLHSPDRGAALVVTFVEGVGGLGSDLAIVKREGEDYGANLRKLTFISRPATQIVVRRADLEEVRDLLMERIYGSNTRSPAHNARLAVESMLSAAHAPSSLAGGEVETAGGETIGNGAFIYRTTITGDRHLVEAKTGFVRVILPYDYRFTDNSTQLANAKTIAGALTPRHEAPAEPWYGDRDPQEVDQAYGSYDGTSCELCKRERVMVGGATGRRICEKCGLYQEAPAEGAGERVYIDCEFDGHNGPLLSVALVRESGDSIHIRADVEPMDLWVRQNVLPLMDSHKAARSEKVYAYEVGGVIRSFLGEGSPVIVCDSPQDARYFSQALTTAPDGGYAPFPFDGLTIEVLGVDAYPTTLEGAVQHNAWWDAMALREALRARSSALEARS